MNSQNFFYKISSLQTSSSSLQNSIAESQSMRRYIISIALLIGAIAAMRVVAASPTSNDLEDYLRRLAVANKVDQATIEDDYTDSEEELARIADDDDDNLFARIADDDDDNLLASDDTYDDNLLAMIATDDDDENSPASSMQDDEAKLQFFHFAKKLWKSYKRAKAIYRRYKQARNSIKQLQQPQEEQPLETQLQPAFLMQDDVGNDDEAEAEGFGRFFKKAFRGAKKLYKRGRKVYRRGRKIYRSGRKLYRGAQHAMGGMGGPPPAQYGGDDYAYDGHHHEEE